MIDLTNKAGVIMVAITVILALLVTTALKLLYRLNHPKILAFPWPSTNNISSRASTTKTTRQQMKDKGTTVVFAGSFNPPHNGHLVMIQYLAMKYKEAIVVIGVNPNKKYAVSPKKRAEILRKMVKTLELGRDCNVRVEVVKGYIWRHAMSNNAKILFRGIRTWEKDGKEERALHKLNLWGPLLFGPMKWPIPTYYLEGNPKYASLSSTLIRDRCKEIMMKSTNKNSNNGNGSNGDSNRKNNNNSNKDNSDLCGLVPKEVEKEIIMAYSYSTS